MRTPLLALIVLGAFVVSTMAGTSSTDFSDCARRCFDFTPLSRTNPALARINTSIAIPVSEFLAYQKAEHLSTLKEHLDSAKKKEILNDLIDEYLLVDEAYKAGADRNPEFSKRMEFTRTLIFSDLLVTDEVETKAKTGEEYNKLLGQLEDRLFDAATIDVSVQAYDVLKNAAKEIDALGPPGKGESTVGAKAHEILEKMADTVLARYNGEVVTVKEILAVYIPLHVPRPRLETEDDLVKMLKPLIVPALMAAEAKRRGMEALPAFQEKIIENRNALLRIYVHGMVNGEANRQLTAPNLDARMKSWYRQNAKQYAVRGADGAETIPAYETIKARLESDYSEDLRDRIRMEKLRALRKTCDIQINEAVLKGL